MDHRTRPLIQDGLEFPRPSSFISSGVFLNEFLCSFDSLLSSGSRLLRNRRGHPLYSLCDRLRTLCDARCGATD